MRAAVIQAFEFTFKAIWKLFQKIGAHEGLPLHSPRSALKFAFQKNFLGQETSWLQMMRDRNLTVHSYHEAVAEMIAERVRNRYMLEMAVALQHVATYLNEAS